MGIIEKRDGRGFGKWFGVGWCNGVVVVCVVSQRGDWFGDGGGNDIEFIVCSDFGGAYSDWHGENGQRPRIGKFGADYRIYRFWRISDFLRFSDCVFVAINFQAA